VPSWNELQNEFNTQPDANKGPWVDSQITSAMQGISGRRDHRNVVLYGSAFLQKPGAPPDSLMITHEDLNGLMSVIYGMSWDKGLTLVLHTPGGVPNAAETIVEYLRAKFDSLEVIVPTLAMSAGTMISLAADCVVMGRQSQLGPIDTQLNMGGRTMSARGVVEQFKRASEEILANPLAAHVWAPITQSLGPALLQDAQNALDYSESMVAGWLARWMFVNDADAVEKGQAVAAHFNDASAHKSHGRRIAISEARAQGLAVESLEDDQALQEAVLTLYHIMTLMFEGSPALKLIRGSNGRGWIKNQSTA
jgi:Serine dehydrogenase proteinase